MADKERKVIGIDFGSSQSSIAIMKIGSANRPELLNLGGGPNGETMPTILAIDENDDSVSAVGNAVHEKYRGDGAMGLKYVSDFKRYFGGAEVEESDPPDVVDAKQNADKYARLYLAEMLCYLKGHFNVDALDPADYETCIAYPATWAEDSRVDRLKQLVKEVGFPCSEDYGIRSIPEPVAAMHSLRVQDMLKFKFGAHPEYFMVIDFGGGTLDICIVKTDILGRTPTIVSTSGNPALGGRDFDDILIKLFFSYNRGRLDSESFSSAEMLELRDKIKEAKESFSVNFKDSEYQTQTIRLFRRGNYDLTVPRQQFYNICEDAGTFEKIRQCIREAMEKAGLTVYKISKVVLTGGSSKWPFVRELVAKEFAMGGEMIYLTDTPFTDVANGCAVAVGRPDSPPEGEGIWVRWKFLEDKSWQEAKCLVEPSTGGVEGRAERQFLGKISGTNYFKSHTICLAWYRGFTKDDLHPDIPTDKDGKPIGTNEARICVFARRNIPVLDRPKRAIRAYRGESTEYLDDTYDIYLCYRKGAGGTVSYQFEIFSRDAAKVESVRLRSGLEKTAGLPQGTVYRGFISSGQVSECGYLGFGRRKIRELRHDELLLGR